METTRLQILLQLLLVDVSLEYLNSPWHRGLHIYQLGNEAHVLRRYRILILGPLAEVE